MDKPFRIAPLLPPYPPEVEASLKKWMPPGVAVEPLALFGVLQRHPALAERLRPLGALLLGKTSLTLRERELVILRSCARCGAGYEWGVHAAAFAAAAGLDAAATAATRAPVPGAPLDDADRALLAIVDELHDTGTVSDAAWDAGAGRFSDAQRLELLALVGFYHLILFVANGARVEPEAWAARF